MACKAVVGTNVEDTCSMWMLRMDLSFRSEVAVCCHSEYNVSRRRKGDVRSSRESPGQTGPQTSLNPGRLSHWTHVYRAGLSRGLCDLQPRFQMAARNLRGWGAAPSVCVQGAGGATARPCVSFRTPVPKEQCCSKLCATASSLSGFLTSTTRTFKNVASRTETSRGSNAAYFNLFPIKQYMYIYIYISEKHQMLNSTKAHVSSADHVCLIGKTGFNSDSLTTTNGRMTPLLLGPLLPGPDRSRAP